MNRGISTALLVIGIVLIVLGVSALKSFSSDVTRFSPVPLQTKPCGF